MRPPLDTHVLPSRPVMAAAAALLLGAGVLAAAATTAQRPVLVACVSATAALLVIAILRPQIGASIALVSGVFAADYLVWSGSTSPSGLETGLVLPVVLLLATGAGSLLAYGMQPEVRLHASIAALLGVAWFLAPLGLQAGGLRYLVASSGLQTIALLGSLAVSSSLPGRIALLRAWVIAGATAAVAAVVEFALVRNPILEYAVSAGSESARQWLEVPERFGFRRAALGFGHPLLLGAFLGMAMLATLELSRRGRLSERWAAALVLLELGGIATTVSRGPVAAALASLLLWAALARRMKTWRRVVLVGLAAATVAIAFWGIALSTDMVSLVRPSESELGQTSQHRFSLAQAFVSELRDASVFGTEDVRSDKVVREFSGTLDNEGLYLIVSRGISGLLTLTALALAPAALALRRLRSNRDAMVFPLVAGAYLLLTGVNVAFFGQLLPFVFVFSGLLWTTVGEPQVKGASDRVPPDLHAFSAGRSMTRP